MAQEVNFLKQRAQDFFEEAQHLQQKEKFNLAAFNLEQAVQLWIKYLLGKKLGEWPQVHYLSELIPQLAEAYDAEQLTEFYEENELFFDNLVDAYFTSRYLPREFSENAVEKLFEGAQQFIALTEEVTGEEFHE